MKTYFRHRSINVVDVKELIALEYLDFEGKYRNYTEKHDFCELCYVESGEITIILSGERKTMAAGEMMFIEPNTEHSYFSERGNESRAFVVCFACPSHTLRLLSGVAFKGEEEQLWCIKQIIGEAERTFCNNESDLLEVVDHPSFGGQQAIILMLEYILIGLFRRLTSSKNSEIVFLSKDKFYPDLVNIVTGYLKNNVRQKITLADICKRFNYSRSFICKIFKDQTGESPISYFNRLKIEEAKKLLCETRMSVGEISELLGFSEAKYFGVSFKNCVGLSPRSYRERCGIIEDEYLSRGEK